MHHSATDFGSRVGCITAIGIIAFGALAVTSNPLLIIGGGMLIALAGLIYAALGVLKLRIYLYPNPLRKRGIAFRGLRRVAGNPSLTLRVMINPSVSPQVNNLSAETRNFKSSEPGQISTPFHLKNRNRLRHPWLKNHEKFSWITHGKGSHVDRVPRASSPEARKKP